MPSLRFLLWTLLAYIAGVRARTRSVIVDDADTNRIIYSEGWNIGDQCGECFARPDGGKALDGTWHDGTESPGGPEGLFFTFNFIGTSVEVRHIAIDLIGPWTTSTNVNYSIDGSQLGVKQRKSTNQTDYLYDQFLFRIDGLSDVEHTLRVDVHRPGVLLFDYLIYTESITNQGGFSSPTYALYALDANSGAIIGGVLSGVVILIVAFMSCYCLRYRRKRAQAREHQYQ